MMTRKDYEAAAKIVKNQINWANNALHNAEDKMLAKKVLRSVARDLAGVMEQDNPRFDRGRFLRACGFAT